MEEPSLNRSKSRDNFLPASILLAAVMISGSIVYLVRSGGTVGREASRDSELASLKAAHPVVSERDVILGDAAAPVSLIEYGDYQCPFCGAFFTEVEPRLREEYVKTGKVRMVYRNFAFLGPESRAAAEAAECAKDQNKFWPYHDALFVAETEDGEEHNGNLNRELFLKLARDTQLDLPSFTACYDSKKYAEKVVAETDEAQALGVSATPTTFVNDRLVRGALPYAKFKEVIDSFLAGR